MVWSGPATATGGWLTTALVKRLKKICETPGVVSCQTTFKLPFLSATISGMVDEPLLPERFCGAAKVAPESVEREKKMSSLPGVLSSQTTLTLPSESTASEGSAENPELLEILIGEEKDVPPLLDRA